MKSIFGRFTVLSFFWATLSTASVYMPYATRSTVVRRTTPWATPSRSLRWAVRRQCAANRSTTSDSTTAAMAIPGYGVAEQVVVGGFANFLSIYNLVITARILLSWFPQAASVSALQPVYAITDPYLNLFRGLIPPLGGLDFSPILAFLLLNALTSATAAVGAELPPAMMKRTGKRGGAWDTSSSSVLRTKKGGWKLSMGRSM